MTKAEIFSKILEVSEKSYYRWKSKDHIVLINLIEKYFSDKELEEFIWRGEISKFERLKLDFELESSIYDIIDEILYNICVTEFICYFISDYQSIEKSEISKNNFIIYLAEYFDKRIEIINEIRIIDMGKEFIIVDDEIKHLTFKSILNVLDKLSSREFKHIVITSDFYNPFNTNYKK